MRKPTEVKPKWTARYESGFGVYRKNLHFESREDAESYMAWWLMGLGPKAKLLGIIPYQEKPEPSEQC